jgi:hypothetical protein
MTIDLNAIEQRATHMQEFFSLTGELKENLRDVLALVARCRELERERGEYRNLAHDQIIRVAVLRSALCRLTEATELVPDRIGVKYPGLRAEVIESRSQATSALATLDPAAAALMERLEKAEDLNSAASNIVARYERWLASQKNPDGTSKSTYLKDALIERLREALAAWRRLTGEKT